MGIEKMKFEKDNENPDSKARIIIKKSAFSLFIFVFETFLPMFAGFEMIISFFINYFIINCLWLFGFRRAAEIAGSSLVVASVVGGIIIFFLHLLYHILIDGIFNASLLIEMNAELFAVFLFLSITDSKTEDNIMTASRYMFLAAACLYTFMLAVYFTAKFLKRKKYNIHIKYKKL